MLRLDELILIFWFVGSSVLSECLKYWDLEKNYSCSCVCMPTLDFCTEPSFCWTLINEKIRLSQTEGLSGPASYVCNAKLLKSWCLTCLHLPGKGYLSQNWPTALPREGRGIKWNNGAIEWHAKSTLPDSNNW